MATTLRLTEKQQLAFKTALTQEYGLKLLEKLHKDRGLPYDIDEDGPSGVQRSEARQYSTPLQTIQMVSHAVRLIYDAMEPDDQIGPEAMRLKFLSGNLQILHDTCETLINKGAVDIKQAQVLK